MRRHPAGALLMHVGVVITGFEPESGGGFTFENEILTALAALAKSAKHRFTLLCPPAALSHLENFLAGSGIAVAAAPRATGRLLAAALRELETFRIHWRRPSDLDHVAAPLGIEFIWFLGPQAARTDIPYLTVVWDLQHRATPWFPEMSAQGVWDARDAWHRWFLQRASAVVTGTQVGVRQLASFFQIAPENTLVLPHPTPRFASAAASPESSPDMRAKFGLGDCFVLYPAQFWAHKNHVNLVLAVALLRRRGLEVHLALPGSDKGVRDHVLAVAAREGAADLIHPLGFVQRDDLVALYRQALALAYVSWCGPENLPPLEAFALGCPVIATDIPGAREQLGDAALFCEPGSPESIADAMARCRSDEGMRANLIAAGSARAGRFTPLDYVNGVFGYLDRFASIRRCWA
jgi:glycosyltransferase involved in cell wall biosynthesis